MEDHHEEYDEDDHDPQSVRCDPHVTPCGWFQLLAYVIAVYLCVYLPITHSYGGANKTSHAMNGTIGPQGILNDTLSTQVAISTSKQNQTEGKKDSI